MIDAKRLSDAQLKDYGLKRLAEEAAGKACMCLDCLCEAERAVTEQARRKHARSLFDDIIAAGCVVAGVSGL